MRLKQFFFCTMWLILIISPSLAFASITVRVHNASGDPVPGAMIVFTKEYNPDNSYTLYSDDDGIGQFNYTPVFVAEDKPESFLLQQNYPNPFNPSTIIPFSLAQSGQIKLTLYNIMGQKVRTLVDEILPKGPHTISWDGHSDNGSSVAAGIYIYRLSDGNISSSRKMLLLDGAFNSSMSSNSILTSSAITMQKPATESFSISVTGEKIINFKKTGIELIDGESYEFTVITVIEHQDIPHVNLPGGSFLMGDIQGGGELSERPVHKVTLDNFEMSQFEVTNAQYLKFLNAMLVSGNIDIVNSKVLCNEGKWSGQEFLDPDGYCDLILKDGIFKLKKSNRESYPMVGINWYGAKAFAEYHGLDLPTEAEWEYACRAGTETYYNTGNNGSDLALAGWYVGNKGDGTHPVGQKEANAWGLYDMHGNVWEWCYDRYDSNYYLSSPSRNPTGSQNHSFNVLRGGAWYSVANDCRSAKRAILGPVRCLFYLGFRVVHRDAFHPLALHSLSGKIVYNNSGLGGVSVHISGESLNVILTSRSDGSFFISGLYNGSYTVNPHLDGYTFSPADRSVSVNGTDMMVDFCSDGNIRAIDKRTANN